MTLIVTKNGTPDTRMIEYDQAIVRLGIEKAAVMSDLERIRSECAEVGTQRDTLLAEIVAAERHLGEVRQETVEVVQAMTGSINTLARAEQKAGESVDGKRTELETLQSYAVSLAEDVRNWQKTFASVTKRVAAVRETLAEERANVDIVVAEKNALQQDVISLQELKKEIADTIALGQTALAEAVEKEQYLNHREAEIAKYEARVKKLREEAGITREMQL